MDDRKGELVELCGLWALPSGKGFSGSLGGARVLVLENRNRTNDKAPAYRVFLARNERRDQPQKQPPQQVQDREPGDDSDMPF